MKATWAMIVLLLASDDCYGAAAQETGKNFRIGYLGSGSPATSGRYAAGFRDALKGLGYVEGQNTVITYRWAAGKFDRLPELVDELLRGTSDVIIGFGGTQVANAIKSATNTLPAVILTDDPVAEGLVKSLARPGRNLTGGSVMQDEAEVKRVQLLKEALPWVAQIAVLRNPDRPCSEIQLQVRQAGGRRCWTRGHDLGRIQCR